MPFTVVVGGGGIKTRTTGYQESESMYKGVKNCIVIIKVQTYKFKTLNVMPKSLHCVLLHDEVGVVITVARETGQQ